MQGKQAMTRANRPMREFTISESKRYVLELASKSIYASFKKNNESTHVFSEDNDYFRKHLMIKNVCSFKTNAPKKKKIWLKCTP